MKKTTLNKHLKSPGLSQGKQVGVGTKKTPGRKGGSNSNCDHHCHPGGVARNSKKRPAIVPIRAVAAPGDILLVRRKSVHL